jgi:hypothetical protein
VWPGLSAAKARERHEASLHSAAEREKHLLRIVLWARGKIEKAPQ